MLSAHTSWDKAVMTDHAGHPLHVSADGHSNVHLGDIHYHSATSILKGDGEQIASCGLCLGQAPQIPPDAFKGRAAELIQLRDWLLPSNHPQRQCIISVVGMGGIGKTQLTLAFAREYADYYSSIFWVSAKDEASTRLGIASILALISSNLPAQAPVINDENLAVDTVCKWLSTEGNDRWLLIFDNYDDPQLPGLRSPTGYDIRKFFPSRSQGTILISTRSTKLAFSQRLFLKTLDDVLTSVQILSHRSGRDLSHDDSDTLSLSNRLGGLPLALATAGNYLASTNISCREYLEIYTSMWTELFDDNAEDMFDYEERTLASTWTVSLDCIRAQDPDVAELFSFFAFLDPYDLSYEYLKAGAHESVPWLVRVTRTPIHFQRAMSKLHAYCLVDVIAGVYQIHPCLHDCLVEAQCILPEDTPFLTAARAVSKLVGSLSNYDENLIVYARLQANAVQLVRRQFTDFWQAYATSEDVQVAMSFIVHVAESCGRFFEQCEAILMQVLAGCKAQTGTKTIVEVRAARDLGRLYEKWKKLDQAKQMYEQAFSACKMLVEEDDNDTIRTMECLTGLSSLQGELGEATDIQLDILARKERKFGLVHSSTLQTVIQLAELYKQQNKKDEALTMFERVLTLGWNVLDVGVRICALVGLGDLCSSSGEHQGAEELHSIASAESEQICGLDSTLTIHATESLLDTYVALGKYQEAEQLIKRLLATRDDKRLGAAWSSFSMLYLKLAEILKMQGRWAESERMFMWLLTKMERTQGQDASHTQNVARSFARFYRENGKPELANEVFQQARTQQTVFSQSLSCSEATSPF